MSRNTPRPHAVTSVSGSVISTTYTYDLNGNQTAGLGRTIIWTSYNQPDTITQGSHSAGFLHDMDHQRYKQVATDGTTLYVNALGVLAELNAPGAASARWADYLAVGNVKVGVRFTEVAAQTVTTRSWVADDQKPSGSEAQSIRQGRVRP